MIIKDRAGKIKEMLQRMEIKDSANELQKQYQEIINKMLNENKILLILGISSEDDDDYIESYLTELAKENVVLEKDETKTPKKIFGKLFFIKRDDNLNDLIEELNKNDYVEGTKLNFNRIVVIIMEKDRITDIFVVHGYHINKDFGKENRKNIEKVLFNKIFYSDKEALEIFTELMSEITQDTIKTKMLEMLMFMNEKIKK